MANGNNNGNVQVNQNAVANHSDEYKNATEYLKAHVLHPKDTLSTISAKDNSVDAFMTGQALLESLGNYLDSEASTIRQSGLVFKEYDDMLANFMESGSRHAFE